MSLSLRLLGSLTREVRLFNKNITDCKTEKFSIVGDVCPVQATETWLQPGQGLVNGGPNLEALKVAILCHLNDDLMMGVTRLPLYRPWTL